MTPVREWEPEERSRLKKTGHEETGQNARLGVGWRGAEQRRVVCVIGAFFIWKDLSN